MMPFERIDRERSSIRSSSMPARGWNLLGRSRSMSISIDRSAAGVTRDAGVSGISALRPRPRAGRFSTIAWLRMLWCRGRRRGRFAREQFTRERKVRFGSARLHVVENRRQSMARRFAETDVARDHGVEDAVLEELADVPRDLLSEIGPLVVH